MFEHDKTKIEWRVIVYAILLTFLILFVALPIGLYFGTGIDWLDNDIYHIPQFFIPFLIILWLSKGRISEYGFTLKSKDLKLKLSIALGTVFGLIESTKYIPYIRGLMPLDVSVAPLDIIGNISCYWLFLGLAEETWFRGLIQTYLMEELRGWIRIFGWDFHVGTIITAMLFFGVTFSNLLIGMPLGLVIFMAIVGHLVGGLIFGYIYQESRSLAGPVLTHNWGHALPNLIGYILYLLR